MQEFNKINNKKRITSYEHLNKKYDLNFSDYNFGFDWEVFKDFVGDSYARYFTSASFLSLFRLVVEQIKHEIILLKNYFLLVISMMYHLIYWEDMQIHMKILLLEIQLMFVIIYMINMALI